ncbi:hypothetical protein XELAEV_18037922mg [Xenopus laevis]|uniref:Uncharacterized protein n=1 Tax=Xenopus laevis TaxID=8355 RepID=A0A974HAM4_XENLA|nr:hypothetical protein XELAEV_18037922mg [Xenopus laevis]
MERKVCCSHIRNNANPGATPISLVPCGKIPAGQLQLNHVNSDTLAAIVSESHPSPNQFYRIFFIHSHHICLIHELHVYKIIM